MFLLVKTVVGFNYYYNSHTGTFEGLKTNATIFTEDEINDLMRQVSKVVSKDKFSFIKHI